MRTTWRNGLALLAALMVLGAAGSLALGNERTENHALRVELAASQPGPSSLSASDEASPARAAEPGSGSASVARIAIPAIGIDRPTVRGLVDAARNEMIAPDGAFDIAYYEYSALPGRGNAVFSGHVDYVGVGPAVFWNLRKLKTGDLILVQLEDGSSLRYAVRFNRTYDAEHGSWGELFGADAGRDVVTLYTCDGDFNKRSGNYNERRVVRAERVS